MTTEAALGLFVRAGLLGTVDLIEPNYIVHATDLVPNDPERNRLWGMHNIGQTGGTLRADISALGAWGIRTDAGNIVTYVPGSLVCLERGENGVWSIAWMLRPNIIR